MNPHPTDEGQLVHVRDALDALACGAALLTDDGTVLHANPRLCEMMRREPGLVVKHNLHEFYAAADEHALIDRSLLNHLAADCEFFIPRPDGSRLPVVASARPLSKPLASLHVVTVIDISAQKRAQLELESMMHAVAQVGDNAIDNALALKGYNDLLETRISERTEDLRLANLDAVYMLAVASEAKDADTGRHVRRIQLFAESLAKAIGLPTADADAIGYAAILHDVGKMHIPDEILKKPGTLSDEERFLMRQHTLFGERILSRRPFFERARKIARSHHENWNGGGYPDGLTGESIPLEARIVRVVDVYDALTTERVYKQAWSRQQAIEFVLGSAGALFERELAIAFHSLVTSGDITTLAQGLDVISEL